MTISTLYLIIPYSTVQRIGMQQSVIENTPSSPIPFEDMGMLHRVTHRKDTVYVSYVIQKGQMCEVYDTSERLIPELCGTYKGLLYRLTDKHSLKHLKPLTDEQQTLNL